MWIHPRETDVGAETFDDDPRAPYEQLDVGPWKYALFFPSFSPAANLLSTVTERRNEPKTPTWWKQG